MERNDFIREKALDIIREELTNDSIHRYQFDAVRNHIPRRGDNGFREYREGILGDMPEGDDDLFEMENRMNQEVDNIIHNLLEYIDGMDPKQNNRKIPKLPRKKNGALPDVRQDGYDRFREILAGRLGSMVTNEFSRDDVLERCFETGSEQERFLAWAETLAENELTDFLREGEWKTWIRNEVKHQWGMHQEDDGEDNPGQQLLRTMSGEEEKQLTERFEKALECLDFGETFSEIVNELAAERLQRKEAIERKAGKPVSRVQALSIMLKEAGIRNNIWPNPSNLDKVRIYLTLPDKLLEPEAGHPKPRVNVYLEYGASPIGKAANEPYDGSPHPGNDPLPRITTDSGHPTFNLELLGKLGNLLVTEGIISPERIGYYSLLTRGNGRTLAKPASPGNGSNPEGQMTP